jgi:hypothetical protein
MRERDGGATLTPRYVVSIGRNVTMKPPVQTIYANKIFLKY